MAPKGNPDSHGKTVLAGVTRFQVAPAALIFGLAVFLLFRQGGPMSRPETPPGYQAADACLASSVSPEAARQYGAMSLCRSPNFGPRPAGMPIDMLVIHYTGMPTAAAALDRMLDPAAQVSAHYMIDEDGTVYSLVDEAMRAWHAGEAFWRGHADVNSCSIGIELVNPGHEFGYRPFPEAQMAALIALARDILKRHPILPINVVGHADVAPRRKTDPGELFDWQRLAAAGIGQWPEGRGVDGAAGDPAAALAAIGYETVDLGQSIAAFQRRFRPACIDGRADGETAGLLWALAEKAM